jgi:hypothetical protein
MKWMWGPQGGLTTLHQMLLNPILAPRFEATPVAQGKSHSLEVLFRPTIMLNLAISLETNSLKRLLLLVTSGKPMKWTPRPAPQARVHKNSSGLWRVVYLLLYLWMILFIQLIVQRNLIFGTPEADSDNCSYGMELKDNIPHACNAVAPKWILTIRIK